MSIQPYKCIHTHTKCFFYIFCVTSGPYLLSTLFNRLYCYAQKHVRSIRAVTKDPCEITEKRYRSIRRINNKPNKKLKMRNLNHSSPYHVSDHKAAITVGVIMGVFLGKFKIIMFFHFRYLIPKFFFFLLRFSPVCFSCFRNFMYISCSIFLQLRLVSYNCL